MKYNLIYSLLALTTFSCNNINDEIYGHWHVYDNIYGDGSYMTLDICDSISPILAKYSIFPSIKGSLNVRNKELKFPGECGIFNFRYEIANDTLNLKNYLLDRIAVSYSKSKCSPIKDLMNDFRVDINYPTVGKHNECLRYFDNDIEFKNILIGRPSNIYSSSYGTGIKLVIEDKFASISEIPLWIKELKKYYSISQFKSLPFRIISDGKVPIYKINLIINELMLSNVDNIYIMVQDVDKNDFLFGYYKIDKETFISEDETKLLNDVLSCNIYT